MSDKTNIGAYLDSNSAFGINMKPYSSKEGHELWIDSNSDIAGNLKTKAEMSRLTTKEGIERRMYKVALPIAGTTTELVNGVLVNTPAAKYTIPAYVVVAVPPQATDADVADALKLLVTSILADTGAVGATDDYVSATNMVRDFLIHGFQPD